MQRFRLTEDHLKLLKHAFVRWEDCETGAPAIDPKRPYGNTSVLRDVAELIGEEPKECAHCGEPQEPLDEERLSRIHRETEMALQIVLQHGHRTGLYESPLGVRWDYVDEVEQP